MKNVLVHFHIYKNAGSTIDWILRKNFGNNFKAFDNNLRTDTIIDIKSILDEIIKYDLHAISSHQIRPLPLESTDFNFIQILFIRHPLDRAFSIYQYQRKTQIYDPMYVLAKVLTVQQYFQTILNSSQFDILQNDQTRFIQVEDHPKSIEISKKIIRNASIIGVVDRFDESMVVAEQVLKQYFPNVDLSYTKQNSSQNSMIGLTTRIDDYLNQLSDNLKSELIKNNNLDFTLYDFTNQELDKRISQIQNFNEKLDNYTERCKSIESIPEENIQKILTMVNIEKKYDTAIPLLDNLKTKTNSALINYLLGFCLHYSKKDYSNALKYYDLALELGFDEFWVRFNRGQLYLELANFKSAYRDLAKCFEITSNNPDLNKLLSELFYKIYCQSNK